MNIRRWTATVIATLMVAGCKKGDAGAKEPEVHAVVGAKTALATAEAFTETVGAIGTVAPRPGHVATLSAPAPGRVVSAPVSTGQAVTRGEALVVLDPVPFETAVRSAQAAYDGALAARDRAKRLVDQGVSPKKDLDSAVADLAKADADLVTARRTRDLATLRSPIAGVVTRMNTTLGASVDPSQALVEVSDPSAVDVILSVEAATAPSVHVGNKVTIHPGDRASENVVGTGEVVDIAASIDTATRGIAVRVRASGGKRPLRIGETVYAEIVVATRPNAVVIPLEALVPEEDGFKVFVVDSEGIAHEQEVRVGGKTAYVAEIVEGLSPGDRVVTYGAFGVEDSSKIVPPGKEGAAPADKADKADKADSGKPAPARDSGKAKKPAKPAKDSVEPR